MNKKLITTTLIFSLFFSFAVFAGAQTSDAVTLVWEALSYTPPLYSGKALLPEGGSVRVSAIVDGVSSPQSLVYTWKQNGTVLGSKSGLGVSSMVFESSITGRRLLVEASVSTQSGTALGQAAILVPTSQPIIRVYENSPSFGTIFEREISSGFSLADEEVQVVAEPYFFSQEPSKLSYSWTMNNRAVEQPGKQNTLTLRVGETSGQASISLEIKSFAHILERAQAALRISF